MWESIEENFGSLDWVLGEIVGWESSSGLPSAVL